jgi:hypothetical protein
MQVPEIKAVFCIYWVMLLSRVRRICFRRVIQLEDDK